MVSDPSPVVTRAVRCSFSWQTSLISPTVSFAGLSFLTLFIAGKVHLWDRVGSGIKAWFTIVPMTGAALVAISRTMDYRHHATDVLAGSLLGIGIAYMSYRQYFPPLNEPTAHLCYPPLRHFLANRNGTDTSSAEQEHHGDEEMGVDHGQRRESAKIALGPSKPPVTDGSTPVRPADASAAQ